ncbi:hypothetical protein GDO86_004324 [Hymenochirus boettgeri]|uniref:Bromodomain adjacent to zinc finger domain protein 2A n=1 Tax=Hymenochirus boettgeri TaxID=247094 RepID=A0A8T2K7W2_9PIPI|nr:hypothetical protein GDO86_004324 [Hymenochirus boettgeri]KAG8452492.1 hypothetical protein GDO86_004324 [Hymenochirus boettgeri]KAG8452493.1 hypothetical protein GDO86_004324 [Hymenochirus boettgeri]
METHKHHSCVGQTPLSNASGLKQLPQSVEPVYTKSFSSQAKGLSYEMPVNGLSNNANGTLSSANHIMHNSTSHDCDYLWNYPKSSSHKDCALPSLYLVNGSTSSLHNGASSKGGQPGSRENCLPSFSAAASISGHDQCSLIEANVNTVTVANGTHIGFCEASLPVHVLASSTQNNSYNTQIKEKAGENKNAGTNKGHPHRQELVEGLEPSDVPTDLQDVECNETKASPFIKQATDPLLPPDVSSLHDPARLPSQLEDSSLLNSDSLEPFGTELSQDPASNTMYDLEDLYVGESEHKNTLVETSSLVCSTYVPPTSFPLIPEDTRHSSTIFDAASASPVLGDSVMQDSASEVDEPPEGSKAEEPVSIKENIFQDEIKLENKSSVHCLAPQPVEEELEPGEVKGTVSRRRIATPEEVCFPLLHGWKREVRIRKGSNRWQGETWYYAPCGKRMKQFPEVIKYLSKNSGDPFVRREHFSFSPRMPVGDFYEEQHTADGLQWILLNSEEIPSRILAITGKRGRPRNMEKAKAKEERVKRGRGRPPKVKMIDLLNKSDAKLLRKLENQDILSDSEKVQLCRLKKKMRRKARNQEAKLEAAKRLKEKADREEKQQKLQEKGQQKEKTNMTRKSKEKPKLISPKPNKKQVNQQRRLEERKRQQFILEELKKPTEDMCLSDHQPLPDFLQLPGLILPSCAFSYCLTTVEFLHSYGKVLGLDPTKDVPSLYTLQEGLFNVGDSLGEVQDLLVKLLRAALIDPGLPPYYQSIKILGEKISEIGLNRDNVSEALRIFLEAYGGDIELCESLRSHPFQAHPPRIKAVVLAFLVNELNASALIISDIDKTLESMSHYRKNKWIIEGKIRRLKFTLTKRTGKVETPEDERKKHSECTMEDNGVVNVDGMEEEGDLLSSTSILELERQIDRLSKRQMFFRKKILTSSQKLRTVCLGQDRYRRCYWMLPLQGGIFIEGLSESTEAVTEEALDEEPKLSSVKSEDVEVSEHTSDIVNYTRVCPTTPRSEAEHHFTSCDCIISKDKDTNGLHGKRNNTAPFPGSKQDVDQSSVLSWLSKNPACIIDSTVLTPDSSPSHIESIPTIFSQTPKGSNETDEKIGQQFLLSSRSPSSNVSQGNSCYPPKQSSSSLSDGSISKKAIKLKEQTESFNSLSSASTSCLNCNKPRKNSTVPMETPLSSSNLNNTEIDKRRGRPTSKLLKQIEQKYYSQLIERPIPADMKLKWWWIKDPVILESLIKVLHPRGIREKTLHKHLSKHLQHLKEMCMRPASDPLFTFHPMEGHPVSQETMKKWSVLDWTFKVDLSVLQWVEDMEQRIVLSDLQQRGWAPPALDSARTDLKYYKHHLEAADDITVKVKRDDCSVYRDPCNPLDLAVCRLLELELNVERRYMKEPLWLQSEVQHEKVVITRADDPLSTTEIEYSITPRLRLWRQTVERCRSAAQLSLCIQQLDRSLAWERSVNRVQSESPFLRSYGSSRRAKKNASLVKETSPSKPLRRRDHSVTLQYSPGESPLSKRRRIVTRSQNTDLTFCEIILMEMESHEEAWPFLEPVNPRLVPGYRKIIKNPMDFSTMRHKLLNDKYSSCEEFAEDAQLVFSNCQLFNDDESEVGKAGLILKKFYEIRWEEFIRERNKNAL